MNMTNLAYFVLVAEEKSFTKAAQKLYISQQALSSRIAKLEESYQTALFERGIPLRLTDAGKVLYESASQILSEMNLCDRRIQEIKDCTMGTLSVGIPVTRGTIMLPQLCTAFHRMYPKIDLQILEGLTTADVENALHEGKVDLAIGYIPSDPTNVISHRLYTERYDLAIPTEMLNDFFPPQKREQILHNPQPLTAFSHFPFVVQDRNTKGGDVFRRMCREVSFEPHVVMMTNNLLTLINLCCAGMGVCTAPSTFLRAQLNPLWTRDPELLGIGKRSSISLVRLESTIGTEPLAINRLRTGMLTHAGKEFIKLATAIYADNPQ